MGIDIISLLSTDGYILCNKKLIRLYGGDCAILVGELCAEYNYYKARGELTPAGSFYSTQENIEANTGLSPHFQRKALKTLQDAEIIKVTKQGLPAKNYYQIQEDKLLKIFTASDESGEGLELNAVNINNNKQIKINNNTLSKDSVRTQEPKQTEFNFGISEEKPKNKSNQDEYLDCDLLIKNFTDDLELRRLLLELVSNRVSIASKERHHFYASTFKRYLDELSKVNDKVGAVKLSLQYNSTLKVMEPNKNTWSDNAMNKPRNPDTNKTQQVDVNSNDLVRNSDGSLHKF